MITPFFIWFNWKIYCKIPIFHRSVSIRCEKMKNEPPFYNILDFSIARSRRRRSRPAHAPTTRPGPRVCARAPPCYTAAIGWWPRRSWSRETARPCNAEISTVAYNDEMHGVYDFVFQYFYIWSHRRRPCVDGPDWKTVKQKSSFHLFLWKFTVKWKTVKFFISYPAQRTSPRIPARIRPGSGHWQRASLRSLNVYFDYIADK